VLVNVQRVSAPGATFTFAIVPLLQTALVRSQPVGTDSLTLYPEPGIRLADVKLAVPAVVVSVLSPKLLVKPNVPSPPTVFLTTRIVPRRVLVNVQVTVPPAPSVMVASADAGTPVALVPAPLETHCNADRSKPGTP